MKSLLLGAAMAALLMPAALAQSAADADAATMEAPGRYLVFFPWNKATLTEDDQRVVGAAVAEFKRTGVARIDVTGFTDTSGSPAYNLKLSERRAEMVAAELERQGVARADMIVTGRGQQDPRIPTADNVREAGNRRVEIVFTVPAPLAEASAPTPAEVKQLVPRLGLTLGALYGHNFGEEDESGTDSEKENDLAGLELTFDAVPGRLVDLALKQAVLYSFNGEEDGINGRTGLALGLKPFDLGAIQPYLHANAGYIYGSGVQDGFVAGPELGFDIDLSPTTLLNAKVAWDHQFRNSDFDRGILWAGVGLGYRF
ncbi:MAG: OmpA family protein [Geminicoccaceae bacterium]